MMIQHFYSYNYTVTQQTIHEYSWYVILLMVQKSGVHQLRSVVYSITNRGLLHHRWLFGISSPWQGPIFVLRLTRRSEFNSCLKNSMNKNASPGISVASSEHVFFVDVFLVGFSFLILFWCFLGGGVHLLYIPVDLQPSPLQHWKETMLSRVAGKTKLRFVTEDGSKLQWPDNAESEDSVTMVEMLDERTMRMLFFLSDGWRSVIDFLMYNHARIHRIWNWDRQLS